MRLNRKESQTVFLPNIQLERRGDLFVESIYYGSAFDKTQSPLGREYSYTRDITLYDLDNNTGYYPHSPDWHLAMKEDIDKSNQPGYYESFKLHILESKSFSTFGLPKVSVRCIYRVNGFFDRMESIPEETIIYATKNNKKAFLNLLLNENCNINLNVQDGEGNTALHHAIIKGDHEICQLLIKKGANQFVTNNNGYSVFFLLQQDEFSSIRSFLNQQEIQSYYVMVKQQRLLSELEKELFLLKQTLNQKEQIIESQAKRISRLENLLIFKDGILHSGVADLNETQGSSWLAQLRQEYNTVPLVQISASESSINNYEDKSSFGDEKVAFSSASSVSSLSESSKGRGK